MILELIVKHDFSILRGEGIAYQSNRVSDKVWAKLLSENTIVRKSFLTSRKADAVRTANTLKDQELAKPIEYNGILYDADETAVTNLMCAIAGEGVEHTWFDADNNPRHLNNGQLKQLCKAIADRKTQVLSKAQAQKAAIQGLETEADVEAYKQCLFE